MAWRAEGAAAKLKMKLSRQIAKRGHKTCHAAKRRDRRANRAWHFASYECHFFCGSWAYGGEGIDLDC